MKSITRILLWIAAVVALLVLIGAILPGTVMVQRSIDINAPASTVYGVVNDLKTYNDWMPWNQKDPDMKLEYGPLTEGKGAWYTWQSENDQVGNGKLSIIESIPDKKVTTSLEFEGFDEPSIGGWDIKQVGEKTSITWSMNAVLGHNPINRWFGLFFDRMIGPDFDNGLSQLKQKIESGKFKSKQVSMTIEPIRTDAMQVLTIMDTARTMGDIGPLLQKAYGEIDSLMKDHALEYAGMPMAWYYSESEPFLIEAAIPVKSAPAVTSGRVKFRKLPPGNAVVVHYYGPYEQSSQAYDRIKEWLKANNKRAVGSPYDIYVDDPSKKKSMYEVRTDIVQPIE
ncbi:SRPBCC family protein [Flavihumibacter sp. ZG627]|uniref:SRPBCC family protein n=1 Tax=Flavihumibacter sp. ZG627 TaxID=1463156 RepID=UPI00057E3CAB|nr:SRPBCC family protein [Flavihumibacter sp. ZG627]KIC91823.1 hypothetical protein HY58_06310 [Flavihumibacter sp. ZG627]